MSTSRHLWHYTSASALLCILRSNELWASSLRDLNDYSEGTYALDRLRSLWASEYRQRTVSDIGTVGAEAVDRLLEGDIEGELATRVFVFSGSQESNRLGLWSRYAGLDGFAVGIDVGVSMLVPSRENSGRFLTGNGGPREVVYDPDEQERLLRGTLEGLCDSARQHIAGLTSIEGRGLAVSLVTIKHPGFVEECETRYYWIVDDPTDALCTGPPRNERHYVPLHSATGPPKYQTQPLPIDGIICGPAAPPPVVDFIREVLEERGYGSIPFDKSDVPIVHRRI